MQMSSPEFHSGTRKLGPNKLPRGISGMTKAAFVAGFTALALMPIGPVNAETAPGNARLVTPFGPAPVSFADLAEKVSPAVVSISVKGSVKPVSRPFGNKSQPFRGLPKDSPFREFFKKFKEQPGWFT